MEVVDRAVGFAEEVIQCLINCSGRDEIISGQGFGKVVWMFFVFHLETEAFVGNKHGEGSNFQNRRRNCFQLRACDHA